MGRSRGGRPVRGGLLTRLPLAIVLLAQGAAGSEPLEGPGARTSYSLGHQIGADLARQGREVDLAALRRGLRDALAGGPPALAPDEMNALLVGLKRGIVAARREERLRGATTRRRAGAEFLAENARREDVVALDSGLQYRVLRPGTGSRPTAGDRVQVRYRSTRLDGTAFHDSLRPGSEPETLEVGGVIPGLGEALQRMRVGARWKVFVPPQLAFGRRGPLADHTVVYDLELLAIVPPDAAAEAGR